MMSSDDEYNIYMVSEDEREVADEAASAKEKYGYEESPGRHTTMAKATTKAPPPVTTKRASAMATATSSRRDLLAKTNSRVGFAQHVEEIEDDDTGDGSIEDFHPDDEDDESSEARQQEQQLLRRSFQKQPQGDDFLLSTKSLSNKPRPIVRQVSAGEQEPADWWNKKLRNINEFTLPRGESRRTLMSRGESRRTMMTRAESRRSITSIKDIFRKPRDEPPIPPPDTIKQYRVLTRSKANNKSPFDRYYVREENAFNWINRYMSWSFHASLAEVTLASYGFFAVLVILFSIVVFWMGRTQPKCIVVFDKATTVAINFVDAMHLSWTTLSTVGYGVIGPGLSSYGTGSQCTGINLLMAFESFVGVCFASVTGAIIFAKVARIQSSAPVVFSDPIVVRYGEGCYDVPFDDGDMSTTVFDLSDELPCPVLEFRILNSMWNLSEGEIMNATVNLVASRLEAPDEEDRRLELHRQKQKREDSFGKKSNLPFMSKRLPGVSLVAESAVSPENGSFFQRVNKSVISDAVKSDQVNVPTTGDDDEDGNVDDSRKPYSSLGHNVRARRNSMDTSIQNNLKRVSPAEIAAAGVTVDEGSFAPKQIYSKLLAETDSHPFFKRTWNIRHVCNEHSPLLPVRIRRMIRKNRGFWPEELNNHEAIRKAINFHEIIVSFSGIANASGCAVYTQKVYTYVDMAVGYSFVNLFGKDKKTSKIIVDTDLLNDVRAQVGGGAEPIEEGKDNPIFEGYLPNALADAVVQGSGNDNQEAKTKTDPDSFVAPKRRTARKRRTKWNA